jgi:hypothetical protein
MLASLLSVEKIKINDKALRAIILYLKDKVLKEVANETMAESTTWINFKMNKISNNLCHAFISCILSH